jgi:hypothetical protein
VGDFMAIIWLFVLGSSVWVLMDANSLKVTRGQLGGGIADMSPLGWFLACLLIWIVGFPMYLAKRPEYQRMAAGVGGPTPPNPWGATPPPAVPQTGAPAQASSGSVFCTTCGRELPAVARFCASCGQPLETAAASPAPQWPAAPASPPPPPVPPAPGSSAPAPRFKI